jgi:hypothetical protein
LRDGRLRDTNISLVAGTISFWFQPNFTSTIDLGDGPTNWACLLSIGQWTSNASSSCWSLAIDPDGTNLVFLAQSNGARYHCLLHFFHSEALRLDSLTLLWSRTVERLFARRLVRVKGRPILLVDGLKRGKEGRKMPAVKSLHQESGSNSKATFIMGHSLQAVAVLAQAAGVCMAVPVAARIHEGISWSNRDRRTLLDKMGFLILGLQWSEPVMVVADAYYAAEKFARALLDKEHHLVTRVKITAVASFPAPPARTQRRGRRKIYGHKTKLRSWFGYRKQFLKAPSPVYGEKGVTLRYYSFDLLWRKLGRVVRFVWVDHPLRGQMILLCTDLTLEPMEILRLYGWRFKIEVSFKAAIHTLGTYAYHFWMQDMTPIHRGGGKQHVHRKSETCRQHIRRKLGAYERHIQLGLIAQGLLHYLALHFRRAVWFNFHTFIRTAAPQNPPSEWVVSHALRHTWPQFLRSCSPSRALKKFLSSKINPRFCGYSDVFNLDKAA